MYCMVWAVTERLADRAGKWKSPQMAVSLAGRLCLDDDDDDDDEI